MFTASISHKLVIETNGDDAVDGRSLVKEPMPMTYRIATTRWLR